MKERRKRRTKQDIETGILQAATKLIEKNGFTGLTATGLMKAADIEPVQFYKRYKDLDDFIDEYVRKYDYWFEDIVKTSGTSSNNIENTYENILRGLFKSLLQNKIMEQLLRWEIANDNETSRRTAGLRELHTLPLCRYFEKKRTDSSVDIVAISALVIGGIYYLILHDNLSSFGGISLKEKEGRDRIEKAISYLSKLIFHTEEKSDNV